MHVWNQITNNCNHVFAFAANYTALDWIVFVTVGLFCCLLAAIFLSAAYYLAAGGF